MILETCSLYSARSKIITAYSKREFSAAMLEKKELPDPKRAKVERPDYLHEIDKLGHELKQNDQWTPLVTPTWIYIFMRVSNDHRLHWQPRRECACFERDYRSTIGGSALWKQHDVRPFVIHGPSPNMSSCMMPRLS